jgi:hypothetical protein
MLWFLLSIKIIFAFFTTQYKRDRIKDSARHRARIGEVQTRKFWSENLNGSDRLKDLGVDYECY